jgi:hypothetical protein
MISREAEKLRAIFLRTCSAGILACGFWRHLAARLKFQTHRSLSKIPQKSLNLFRGRPNEEKQPWVGKKMHTNGRQNHGRRESRSLT